MYLELENKAMIESLQLAINCLPHTLQYISALYDERKIETANLMDSEGDI
jgi:hypothetical protein